MRGTGHPRVDFSDSFLILVHASVKLSQPAGRYLLIHSREERSREMKIQCNVCEVAEAKVLCCADEAALCWGCDHQIHAANKLASKHHRVPLSSSSSMPKCDICQVQIKPPCMHMYYICVHLSQSIHFTSITSFIFCL